MRFPRILPHWWEEVLWLGLGAVGFMIGLTLYARAFPSATLDLQLSREQITEHANEYLRGRGFDLKGWHSHIGFDEDAMGVFYLQRTLGLKEMERLVREENLPIYFWTIYYFKVDEDEEYFEVNLLPDGTVIGWMHRLPEDTEGAKLSEDDARRRAENFLATEQGWVKTDWVLDNSRMEGVTGKRADYHFEWTRRDWQVGGEGTHLRAAVTLQGDEIGGFQLHFDTPDEFWRKWSDERNAVRPISAVLAWVMLFGELVAIGYGVRQFMRASPRTLRAGLTLSLLVILVGFLTALNYLPTLYPDESVWEQAARWFDFVMGFLLNALTYVALLFLMWLGAQGLARGIWLRQDKVLPRQPLWGIVLARSTLRGLMLGGVMLAYTVLFYIVAVERFGAWTPTGIDNPEVYSDPFPFFTALNDGLGAAVPEELVFRLFGIALVLKWTNRKWLAVLIPGVIWACGHLGYIVFPVYLRVIELTLSSVLVLGLVFWRYDLTTTIVGHMTYNALLTVIPLVRSSHPYYFFGGLLVVGVLLSPIVFGVLRDGVHLWRGTRMPVRATKWRTATMADVQALHQLIPESLPWAQWVSDRDMTVTCIENAGQVVAVAVARREELNVARIEFVYVAPPWRGQFWASLLMDDLRTRLQQEGVEKLIGVISATDRTARRFATSTQWQDEMVQVSQQLTPRPRVRMRSRMARLFDPFRGA